MKFNNNNHGCCSSFSSFFINYTFSFNSVSECYVIVPKLKVKLVYSNEF